MPAHGVVDLLATRGLPRRETTGVTVEIDPLEGAAVGAEGMDNGGAGVFVQQWGPSVVTHHARVVSAICKC
eukprot:4448241-Pyramimonas_sp.AAC.1